jgi:hypothetical protein
MARLLPHTANSALYEDSSRESRDDVNSRDIWPVAEKRDYLVPEATGCIAAYLDIVANGRRT